MENSVKYNNFPFNNLSLHKKRINEIEKIIDALLDIKSTLSKEMSLSPFIRKSKLQSIVLNVKEKSKDDIISKEIDNVFDEYLNNESKIIPTGKDIWNNNSNVFKPGVEAVIDNAVKDLNDQKLSLEDMENATFTGDGNEKGVSLTKRDGHFKTSINDLDNAS